VGDNGTGKTSLLEGVAWTALGRSFRGLQDAALIRVGAEQAILRTEVAQGERRQLVEAELRRAGRNRVLLNHHPLGKLRDLLGVLRVTVFAPDDLELVKGGPAGRRGYLDDLLVAIAPRYEGVRSDYERVLRHRNALLRGGLRGEDASSTLEVFDDQLAAAAAELVRGRLHLISRLAPAVDAAYRALAGGGEPVQLDYEAEWTDGAAVPAAELAGRLRAALVARRRQESERGVTLVGPHRDDLRLTLGPFDARTHASQGEQRTFALALRLGAHRVCIEVTGDEPVLLLDDVFSELDPGRSDALLHELSAEQTLLTTAGVLPAGVEAAQVLRAPDGLGTR
jgi:DNA replication and repair protein RecF